MAVLAYMHTIQLIVTYCILKYQKNKLILFIEEVIPRQSRDFVSVNYKLCSVSCTSDNILLENLSKRDPTLASFWLKSGWDPDLPEFLSRWTTVKFMLFTRRTLTIVNFIIKTLMHCYIEKLYFPRLSYYSSRSRSVKLSMKIEFLPILIILSYSHRNRMKHLDLKTKNCWF